MYKYLFFGLLILVLISTGFYLYKNNFSPELISQPLKQSSIATVPQKELKLDDINKLASDKYSDGNLPLGDNKYVTDSPKKGYIYLCNARKDMMGGGAGVDGPWIKGSTWNIKEKISVSGNKSWTDAQFSNTLQKNLRTISSNSLPISHTTGIYPVSQNDPAYQYDRNPNSIKSQVINKSLPQNPVYSDKPYCIGGEVGIMLTGVAIYNGFDATLRDAAAHELQDACQGHPEVNGLYHYHSLSSCIKDASIGAVIGFALDGFPITGPKTSEGKYLTTDDLDECHGLTSEVSLDGKVVSTYHYVMTQDFPYSTSCFRGKPVSLQVVQRGGGMSQPDQPAEANHLRGPEGGPPQEAIDACSSKSDGAPCSFQSPHGTISGDCRIPPQENSLICISGK